MADGQGGDEAAGRFYNVPDSSYCGRPVPHRSHTWPGLSGLHCSGLRAHYDAPAERVFDQPWRLDLSCCGRHFTTEFFADYETADRFRESYCTGVAVDPRGYSGDGHSGHQRAGIITDLRVRTSPGSGADS